MARETYVFIWIILVVMGVFLTISVIALYNQPNNIKYDIVEIEGMTCLRTYEDSLTCDWDEWQGGDKRDD